MREMKTESAEHWVALTVMLLSGGAALAGAVYLDRQVVDDAAISLAYAVTAIEGHGLRATPYSQIVEGYSNPLWVLSLGFAYIFGVRDLTFARWGGFLFAMCGALLLAVAPAIADRRRLRCEDTIALIVTAFSPTFLYWATGGLETGLYIAASAGVVALSSMRRGLFLDIVLGLLLSAACLTRPEGVTFAGMILLALLVLRKAIRTVAVDAVVLALVVGGHQLFRHFYFRAEFPNTFYAKKGWDFNTWQYLTTFATDHGVLCGAALVAGLMAVGYAGRQRRLRVIFPAIFVLNSVFFVFIAHGDWMMESRFLAPIIPFLGALVSEGVALLRQQRVVRPKVLNATLRALMVAAVFAVLTQGASRFEHVKNGGSDVPVSFTLGQPLGVVSDLVREMRLERPLIAAADLGVLSCLQRNAEVIDLAGLADIAIARHGRNPSARLDYLESEGLPSIALAWGPGAYFRNRFAHLYEARQHVLVLKGLSATYDPRCRRDVANIVGEDVRDLAERILEAVRGAHPEVAIADWRCALERRAADRLPRADVLEGIAAEAYAKSKEREKVDKVALRYLTLRTLLLGNAPGLRIETELQRARLFDSDSTEQ